MPSLPAASSASSLTSRPCSVSRLQASRSQTRWPLFADVPQLQELVLHCHYPVPSSLTGGLVHLCGLEICLSVRYADANLMPAQAVVYAAGAQLLFSAGRSSFPSIIAGLLVGIAHQTDLFGFRKLKVQWFPSSPNHAVRYELRQAFGDKC